MHFMLVNGWYCQFLEADLKTSLPKKISLSNPEKLAGLIERGRGFTSPEIRNAFAHALENGRGGVYLELTEEQYRKLKQLN